MGSDNMPYRGPRIGLCLPYEGSATAQDVVDVAQAAEWAGLDSVWVGDHIAFPVEFTSQNPTMADGKYPYPTDNPRLEALLTCLLYTSPSPRDRTRSRMPSSA